MKIDVKCEREDCRFAVGPSTTTCMYFPPIYDMHGNNTNPDRNTTITMIKCLHLSCGREWGCVEYMGKCEFTELKHE